MEKKFDPKEIDANFVISSFKNKERRNNPSMPARPLLPPGEVERLEKENAEASNAVNESDSATIDSVDSKSDTAHVSREKDISAIGNKQNAVNEGTVLDTGNDVSKAVYPESAKRTTLKQRKASFEEYQKLFLQTPKIVNRKPVFISESTRDRLNKIARKLGDDNMSASGFLENLALHHLDMYNDDVEMWKKL